MNLLIITLLLFVFNLGLAQRTPSPPVKTCQPNHCMNGGTCYETWRRSRCHCRAGYVGLRCEHEDPCKRVTCLNGGRCYRYGTTQARCSCYGGYRGPRCGQETVCATRNPCQNGGRCYPHFGGYRCRCQRDFGGRNCSKPNPCLSNPCQNGGTCSSSKTYYSYDWRLKCRCPSSHRGSRCEIASVCATERPCKNGGSCYPTYHGNYMCRCQGGYRGQNCTEETPCKNFECINGGRCYSYSNAAARCDCLNGFWGQHCEKASVCAVENPCKNGGTCYPGFNGSYRCQCQTGSGGRNCTESDPCSRNPCQNGGTCHSSKSWDSRWNQSCRCPRDYIGKNCETEDPCKRVTCLNGGRCYRYGTTQARCSCHGIYWGPRCGQESLCKNFECINGGHCLTYDNGTARCYCLNGFWGQHCEKAGVCAVENPCKNGGTCYPGFNGSYRCQCQTGSGGRNCTESDPCSRNPCQNGGTCHSSKSRDSRWNQSCRCPRDYIGKNCETEDPCKRVTCLNGGRCYRYGTTQARCSCYGGYWGPRCGQEPCPISILKCGMHQAPGPGDFDTCREQIEESVKQRNLCFDRQIKDAIENETCSCSESDFMITVFPGLSSYRVLSVCSPRITLGQNLSRCDESTKQCAELGLSLFRSSKSITFCNQTLKTQIEGCIKKLDEGQLSFSGCGAYEYLIKETSYLLYGPLLFKCYACNRTDAILKCQSVVPEQSSSCKRAEGRNLNKTLDCFSTCLKESCAPGSDWAVEGYIRYFIDYGKKLQEGCAKFSKHMEERAKLGCPTAAPTTPSPLGLDKIPLPFPF